jgi:hypothetical protein
MPKVAIRMHHFEIEIDDQIEIETELQEEKKRSRNDVLTHRETSRENSFDYAITWQLPKHAPRLSLLLLYQTDPLSCLSLCAANAQ